MLFLAAVAFFQGRILKVEIVGNGAYYEREILAILDDAGVGILSAAPADTGKLTAAVLALPRVEFCSFSLRGGIFTVEVQCAEEVAPLEGEPLIVPVSGVVEELVVVRGTPLVAVGDEVTAGDVAVANWAIFGERELAVLVIAKLTVRYEVEREYELEEREALAQAYLDFGELADLHTTKTERGWLVGGTAFSTAASGLD